MDNEPFEKPTRGPDFMFSYGSAFWWEEMVYLSAIGLWSNIHRDQDSGALYVVQSGQRIMFAPRVQEEHDKWWYETFESKFLGEPE